MNCKPNDMAIILRAKLDGQHIGKIITCIEWMDDEWGGGWTTFPILKTNRGQGIIWHDDDLRPIRDPGDDAVDETLLRIPAPKIEEEMACTNS